MVAGAGSGKTKVLTTRLIHIICQKLFKSNIVCDLHEQSSKRNANRVMQYLKEPPTLSLVKDISLYKRKTRRHAEALGYKSNFTILDTDDQKLIRNIVKAEDLDAKKFSLS